MTLPTHTQPLDHQVYAIDTGFERACFDAAYLVVDDGRAAFIDTGHKRRRAALAGGAGRTGA